MARTLEEWRGIVRQMKSMETSSILSDEAKIIDGESLKAAMALAEQIEDVEVKRMVSMAFTIRTRYEAIDEIIEKHLVGDPELAIEIAEAAGGAAYDSGVYLA